MKRYFSNPLSDNKVSLYNPLIRTRTTIEAPPDKKVARHVRMLELCPLLVIKIRHVNAQYAHCFHAPLRQGARPHACELVPREHAERGSGQNYGAVAASPHKLWAQRPAPTRPSEAARLLF